MALNNEPAASARQKKTFLVFNRITGDVVSIHHVSHASGVDLPDNRVLEAHVLRTTSAAQLSQELGVIAYEGKAVDAATLHVDVHTLRVISRGSEHRQR